MNHLWAPWRMEFIQRERREGCIFCSLPAEPEKRRENLILHVGRQCFVVFNRYPYTCGHMLVIPLRHTDDFVSLTPEENSEAARFLQVSMRILEENYHPEGFNLGMNLGRCAGAGIREHLHHHLIPRWVGDANFLPVIGNSRSLPELLTESYDRLRPHFRQLEENGTLAAGGHARSESEAVEGKEAKETSAKGGDTRASEPESSKDSGPGAESPTDSRSPGGRAKR